MKRFFLLISLFLGVALIPAAAQTAISLPNYVTPASAGQSVAAYWVPQYISIDSACGAIRFVMVGYSSQASYQAGAAPVQGAEHEYDNGNGSCPGSNYLQPSDNISSSVYAQYFSTATVASLSQACVSAAMTVDDIPVPGSNPTTYESFFSGGTAVP